jgi:uncharacterized protein
MTDNYIVREIEGEMKRLAGLYPVIVVTGPRQSGKTTLCKTVFKSYHYVNLEDLTLREQIAVSPKTFLTQYAQGIIVDEAQQLPDLFSFIQVVVDEVPNCHFVLTGSSNFTLMEKVTQSLAGRSATLTLLPLSLKELGSLSGNSTDTLIINGGYPAIWAKNIPTQDLNKQYYNTYIERDIRQLLKVKDLIKFQVFIRLCAGRLATELNASALANEVGVSAHTIIDWISVLEASYIIFRLPPYFRNIGKRLVKTPKLYFCDTGIACFLLGIDNESQLKTHPLRGALFENTVVLEFMKHRYNNGKLPNLFFYRDKSQREIDLIQEFGNEVHAYEIKSARSFHKDFLKNLVFLKELLGESLVSTQVIYDGEQATHSNELGVVNFRNMNLP